MIADGFLCLAAAPPSPTKAFNDDPQSCALDRSRAGAYNIRHDRSLLQD